MTKRWLGIALTAIAIAAAPAARAAGASDLFYERTVMVAANTRCGLFAPPVASALAAAQAQARGAALRAGWNAAALRALETRARSAAYSADCDSRDIAIAAGRVRTAFAGYAQLTRMSYPGDVAAWAADRTTPPDAAAWGLTQDVRFGWDRMVFGLAGWGERRHLMAVARFADGASPYAARLVLRDTARTSGPYLDRVRAGAKVPLAYRVPPAAAAVTFAAEARSAAGRDLSPRGMAPGVAFRFPAAAASAMAGLDPREAIAVEFVFAGRGGVDAVRTAYVEVGDFAAGRAFLSIAQR
jgi:hypothetical protein